MLSFPSFYYSRRNDLPYRHAKSSSFSLSLARARNRVSFVEDKPARGRPYVYTYTYCTPVYTSACVRAALENPTARRVHLQLDTRTCEGNQCAAACGSASARVREQSFSGVYYAYGFSPERPSFLCVCIRPSFFNNKKAGLRKRRVTVNDTRRRR